MSKPRKVIVAKQRTIHTYSEIWHASDCVFAVGIENPKGSTWQFLSSLVLRAFSFEAYLNHVGAVTFSCWEELDRLPPWSKFELLCEELNVSFPEGHGVRPLQTISKLMSFRNTIAHGRSGEIKSKPIPRTTENYQSALNENLLTDWEQLVQTDEFARCAREDVRAVLEKLHEGRRDEKEPLLTFGLGLHGATLAD